MTTYLATLYQDLATVVEGMADTGVPRPRPRPSLVRLRRDPGNSVNLRWLLLKRGLRDKSLGWRISYAIPPFSAQGLVWNDYLRGVARSFDTRCFRSVENALWRHPGSLRRCNQSFINPWSANCERCAISSPRFLRRSKREKIEYFRARPTLTKIYNSRWTCTRVQLVNFHR